MKSPSGSGNIEQLAQLHADPRGSSTRMSMRQDLAQAVERARYSPESHTE